MRVLVRALKVVPSRQLPGQEMSQEKSKKNQKNTKRVANESIRPVAFTRLLLV